MRELTEHEYMRRHLFVFIVICFQTIKHFHYGELIYAIRTAASKLILGSEATTVDPPVADTYKLRVSEEYTELL